jgi:uncharacterized protein with HEPN domain
LYNFQSLAEHSRHLSPDLKETHPEVCWDSLYGIRVLLMYDSLGNDLNLVWVAASQDVVSLKASLAPLLAEATEVGSADS